MLSVILVVLCLPRNQLAHSVEGMPDAFTLSGFSTDFPPSLFGFLTGVVTAGGAVYYYILGEYRVSNEMLTEDIYVCFSWFCFFCRCVFFMSILRTACSSRASYLSFMIEIPCKTGFCQFMKANYLPRVFGGILAGSSIRNAEASDLRSGVGGEDRSIAEEEMIY